MKIISLELKGYKRLSLTSIEHFKYTPQSKIQLILGSNGSGKSSVIKELSPLPAIPTEYSKDGFKIIVIEHRGFTYILKSIFSSSGNKFHFIKNDEELNPGGTVSVYKELVKKEFNITQDVHDLMIGAIGFHSMSVAERRNWFTRISDADYSYAISYYNKLREQLRDMQGAIKLSQSRIVQESEKLLKPEEEQQYREEIAALNKMLSSALELRTPMTLTRRDIENRIIDRDNCIEDLSQELISYRAKFLNFENFTSVQHIDDAIVDSLSKTKFYQTKYDELCTTIETEQKTLEALQKSNSSSSTDVDKVIHGINEEIDLLYGRIKVRIRFDSSKEAYQALLSVYDTLVTIFTSIEANIDKRYSKDKYIKALEYYKQLNQFVLNLDQEQLKLINKRKELEHYRDHNQVECPKCRHVWAKGYDDRTYKEVLAQIEHNEKILVQKKEEQTKQEQTIQQIKDYLEHYRAYLSISCSWSVLNPLWQYITSTNIVFESPRQVITLLETLKADLLILIKIDELLNTLNENIKLKELLSKNQQNDLKTISENIDRLTTEIHRLNLEIIKSKNDYSRLSMYKEACNKIEHISNELESRLDERSRTVDDLVSSVRRESLNELINALQLELSKREQLISKVDIQKALVKNLEAQVIELTEKVEVLKMAVKELSPTEGLIAKGLTGFINHFVNQINSFIKKIWLYPLELVPVTPEADEDLDLDYKFCVKVNNNNIIPDVSKASSAMKEVIDLAFRLVSMTYLNLSEAPLYLDEFARSLDSSHRDSAFYVITNLMTSANFSQIFMISHYEHSYGSLKNTDVTVLCPSNVVLPKDMAFNKVVSIT